MISLIYVSTSRDLMKEQELLGILKKSRENNDKYDLTGLLLYKGGNFMQVLEGDEEKVEALYETIRKDPRHKDVTVISREQIQERQFSKWEMAFRNLDSSDIQNEPGYSEFLHDEFTADIYHENPSRAYIMLLTFRDNLR